LHAKRAKTNANAYINYNSKRMNAHTRQQVTADTRSFPRVIVRINCSNTHIHTQTAW